VPFRILDGAFNAIKATSSIFLTVFAKVKKYNPITASEMRIDSGASQPLVLPGIEDDFFHDIMVCDDV
jgi:hypothetical protein